MRLVRMSGDELVDLYVTTKVYFGEMTIYPAAGVRRFASEKWNRYFGDLWDLSTRVTAAAPFVRAEQ